MKAKHLLLIPALLVAVLCLATTCKETSPAASVRCTIIVTNDTPNAIRLNAQSAISNINADIKATQKNQNIEFWLLSAKGTNQNAKLSFSNASAVIVADTTLTLKQPAEKINVTINADLTLTITEKPY